MISSIRNKIDHIKDTPVAATTIFYYAIYVIPIILYLSLVIRYAINVPFWDEWGTIDLYKELREGTLSIHTLWVPHNEHRSILFYIIYLSIAWFSGFNAIAPVYFGIAFKFITLLLLSDLVRRTLKEHPEIAYSIILFSPIFIFAAQEGEVVFWGFASLLFNLGALFAILLFWGMIRFPDKFLGVFISSLAAIGGSLISANGIFLWGLGILFLLFDNYSKRKKFLASNIYYWICVMSLFLFIYFRDYNAVNTNSTLAWILSHKQMVVYYFLAYMASLTSYDSDNRAILFGILGLLFLTMNLVYLVKRKNIKPLHDLAPWFLLSLYVLLVAFVTTFGRAQFGAWQARSPRYVIMSYPYWLSLFVISSVSLKLWVEKFSFSNNIKKVSYLATPAIIFIVPVSIAFAGAFFNLVPYWHSRFSIGLQGIYKYPYASEIALSHIYPNPAMLNPYIEYLDKNNLGPFAPGYRPRKNVFIQSIPLPQNAIYSIDLNDKNVWTYQGIHNIENAENSWDVKRNRASFSANPLPETICINDYKYLYTEMAASSTVTPPRVMQIVLKSAPDTDNKVNEYLLMVPFVTGDELTAYSLDLQNYNFPQATEIVSMTIFPFGQDAQLSTQARSTLNIQKLVFMGMNSPSSCDK